MDWEEASNEQKIQTKKETNHVIPVTDHENKYEGTGDGEVPQNSSRVGLGQVRHLVAPICCFDSDCRSASQDGYMDGCNYWLECSGKLEDGRNCPAKYHCFCAYVLYCNNNYILCHWCNTPIAAVGYCLICKKYVPQDILAPCPASNPKCANGCCKLCLIPTIDSDRREPMRCQACQEETNIQEYSTALGFQNYSLTKRIRPDLAGIAFPVPPPHFRRQSSESSAGNWSD